VHAPCGKRAQRPWQRLLRRPSQCGTQVTEEREVPPFGVRRSRRSGRSRKPVTMSNLRLWAPAHTAAAMRGRKLYAVQGAGLLDLGIMRAQDWVRHGSPVTTRWWRVLLT
jgi:hypothetical protein